MNRIQKIKKYYNWGGRFVNDPFHITVAELNRIETQKTPMRYDVINFLLKHLNKETNYLEIGVRNPEDNFNKIIADTKYSVDPGIEFKSNPVDFKITSDDFFSKLFSGEVLNNEIKFDVIFIDGLHLAEQVDKDINNALNFISDDGFIVLHDCNPPTQWHARETHNYEISPAMQNWNGSTWKAFVKYRKETNLSLCCIDSDWGIGIISKSKNFGPISSIENPYFEFHLFNKNRKESLNLLRFSQFKRKIESH